MSQSTITVGGKSVTLVPLPADPAPRQVEFSISDAVATGGPSFTGQVQAMKWPGADLMMATITYAPLTLVQARRLQAFLMQMRGMACATQIGDPMGTHPEKPVQGVPVVDALPGNSAGAEVLHTKGWPTNAVTLMRPGEYLQVGYRLYTNLDLARADANGKATLNVWPSLREVPADGATLRTVNARGLFRLATNKRTWSADVTRLTRISIQLVEYR